MSHLRIPWLAWLAIGLGCLGGKASAQVHPFHQPSVINHGPSSAATFRTQTPEHIYQAANQGGPLTTQPPWGYPSGEPQVFAYGHQPQQAWMKTSPCGHGTPCGACCIRWRGEIRGLFMTWERPNFGQLSFDDTNLLGQVLSTHTELGRWFGGAEFRLGRRILDHTMIEAGYWGIYPSQRSSTVLAADLVGNLNTVFDFSPLNIGATNVNTLFDAAQAHRVQRDFEIHNLELHLLHRRSAHREWVSFGYLAGVRYFQFREGFSYASADTSPFFGVDPANEVYYDIDVENHLVGFQMGVDALAQAHPFLALRFASRFGIYGNQIDHHSHIRNVNGTAVVGPGNPLAGSSFDISSDSTRTSFLGELDTAVMFTLPHQWSLSLGYRAIAVSGIAWSTEQIPANFADLPGVADVDANATLVVHGAYLGVERSW